MTGDDIARLAYLGLLAAAVAGWFFAQNRQALGKTAQQAAVWGLIFVGAIAAFGLWSDIQRNVTSGQQLLSDGRIVVPVGRDGHYNLTLLLNGAPVDFVVDTGASEMVLARRDAVRAGIDPDGLTYLGSAMTANGPVRTAFVTLQTVEVAGLTERDIRATVTDGALDTSLLGMSYLRRFARIEIVDGELILTR